MLPHIARDFNCPQILAFRNTTYLSARYSRHLAKFNLTQVTLWWTQKQTNREKAAPAFHSFDALYVT
jgi:hypothetical protein